MPLKKSIKLKVHFTPTEIDEMALNDKNVVVVDVLRASTTIAAALRNGAKDIIPVNTIDSAIMISSNLFGDVTLRAGERNGRMIEGFNLGNSPLDYKTDVVNGKSIILLTANGSPAIVKGRHAKNLIVASFVNLGVVVDFLQKLHEDFVIICAGKENSFCIEDAVCAGRIINELGGRIDDQLISDDAASAASMLDKSVGRSILKVLRNSEHGRYLADIGFAEDIKICAAIDSIPILPSLAGNIIRAAKDKSKHPS